MKKKNDKEEQQQFDTKTDDSFKVDDNDSLSNGNENILEDDQSKSTSKQALDPVFELAEIDRININGCNTATADCGDGLTTAAGAASTDSSPGTPTPDGVNNNNNNNGNVALLSLIHI